MEHAGDHGLVCLDREGDLILVVGSVVESRCRRFLVSSKALSLASSVFTKMLGPNFKEGQQLRVSWSKGDGSLLTIALNEDDADAMDFILSALHYKTCRTKDRLSAEEIVKVAIHSDKYNLSGALNPWIQTWCDEKTFPVDPRNKLRDMGYGILAAYLFRSPNLGAMSARWVRDMPPDFATTWAKYDLLERLPEEVWSKQSGLLPSQARSR
jgi:hypothetical protein